MSILSSKIQGFLDEIKKLENASSEEREKAIHLLTESIEGKNIYVLKPSNENEFRNIALEVKRARARLEDIHSRLDLTIKSGLASESIH